MLNCLKGRKRPAKQLAVPVRPSGLECWQEVMCDMEGPNPPDKDGNKKCLDVLGRPQSLVAAGAVEEFDAR